MQRDKQEKLQIVNRNWLQFTDVYSSFQNLTQENHKIYTMLNFVSKSLKIVLCRSRSITGSREQIAKVTSPLVVIR